VSAVTIESLESHQCRRTRTSIISSLLSSCGAHSISVVVQAAQLDPTNPKCYYRWGCGLLALNDAAVRRAAASLARSLARVTLAYVALLASVCHRVLSRSSARQLVYHRAMQRYAPSSTRPKPSDASSKRRHRSDSHKRGRVIVNTERASKRASERWNAMQCAR